MSSELNITVISAVLTILGKLITFFVEIINLLLKLSKLDQGSCAKLIKLKIDWTNIYS